MSNLNETIFDTASKEVGVKEWPGARHNERVLEYFKKSLEGTGKTPPKEDEVPWCAAFVGAILAECGIQGAGSLWALDYAKWGEKVELAKAKRGDICVWQRESGGGHVGFFVGQGAGKIQVLGGNQSNSVKVSEYPAAMNGFVRGYKLVAIRRAKAPRQSVTETKTWMKDLGQLVTSGGTATVITSVGDLDQTTQILLVGSCVIIAALALWGMRNRKRDFDKGVR